MRFAGLTLWDYDNDGFQDARDFGAAGFDIDRPVHVGQVHSAVLGFQLQPGLQPQSSHVLVGVDDSDFAGNLGQVKC